jgi:hypothetical protein
MRQSLAIMLLDFRRGRLQHARRNTEKAEGSQKPQSLQ